MVNVMRPLWWHNTHCCDWPAEHTGSALRTKLTDYRYLLMVRTHRQSSFESLRWGAAFENYSTYEWGTVGVKIRLSGGHKYQWGYPYAYRTWPLLMGLTDGPLKGLLSLGNPTAKPVRVDYMYEYVYYQSYVCVDSYVPCSLRPSYDYQSYE